MYSFIISISQSKLNKHIIYCFTSIRRNPIFTDFDVETDQLNQNVHQIMKRNLSFSTKYEIRYNIFSTV